MYAHGLVTHDEKPHQTGRPFLKSVNAPMTSHQHVSAQDGGGSGLSQFNKAVLQNNIGTSSVSNIACIVKPNMDVKELQPENPADASDQFQESYCDGSDGNPANSSTNSSLSKHLSYSGWRHFSLRQNEIALRYATEAIRAYQGLDGFLSATLWCNIGYLLYLLNQNMDDAISALTKAFQILSGIRSSKDRRQRDITTVQTLLLLAHARGERIRDHDPIQLLSFLIEVRERSGCDHPSTVPILRTLGTFYMVRELYEPATTFFKEACRVLRAAKSDDKEQMISLMYLGQCYQGAGRNTDALSCYEAGLNLKGSRIWSESVDLKSIASTLFYNIGMVHSSQSRGRIQPWNDPSHQRENALQSFHACLELRKSCYGADHHTLGNVFHNIAILVMEEGDVSSSIVYFEESLRVWRKEHTAYQGGVASSLRYLAYVYKEQGDFHQAIDYFTEALDSLRRVQCESTELLIEVLVGLGLTQRKLGLIDQASKSYEEAAQLLRERTQLGNGEAVHHMVRLLTAMGNLALDLSETDAANAFFYEAANLDPDKDDAQPKSCRRLVELSPKQFPRHSAAA